MMNYALWIVQGVLAVVFFAVGVMKIVIPKEKAVEKAAYSEDFSQSTLCGIGFLEMLGAMGLVLPGLIGFLPVLTPLAAVGLMLTMIGAAATHIRRQEFPLVGPNVVLFLLAAFVAYGRFVLLPL